MTLAQSRVREGGRREAGSDWRACWGWEGRFSGWGGELLRERELTLDSDFLLRMEKEGRSKMRTRRSAPVLKIFCPTGAFFDLWRFSRCQNYISHLSNITWKYTTDSKGQSMNCIGLLSCLFSVLFVILILVKSSTHEQDCFFKIKKSSALIHQNLASSTPFWHFLCQVNHAAMPPAFPSIALLYLQPPNGSNISSIFPDTSLTLHHISILQILFNVNFFTWDWRSDWGQKYQPNKLFA